MKQSTLLQSWDSVKNRVHDVSGCDDPQNWLFKCTNGIFYPTERATEPVIDELYDALDPDASDEAIEALGYKITYSNEIQVSDIADIRDGCGHSVIAN